MTKNKKDDMSFTDLSNILSSQDAKSAQDILMGIVYEGLKPIFKPAIILLTLYMLIIKGLQYMDMTTNNFLITTSNIVIAWWVYAIIISPFAVYDYKKLKNTVK